MIVVMLKTITNSYAGHMFCALSHEHALQIIKVNGKPKRCKNEPDRQKWINHTNSNKQTI